MKHSIRMSVRASMMISLRLVYVRLAVVSLVGLQPSFAQQPQEQRIEREAVPEAAAQLKMKERVHELFQKEFAAAAKPAQKVALAKRLLKQGTETSDDTVARFVLLSEARDLAVEGRNLDTAWGAIDAIAQFYDVNALAEKRSLLTSLVKFARTPGDFKIFSDQYLMLIREAVLAGEWDSAEDLSVGLLAVARRSRIPALQKRSSDLAGELKSLSVRSRRAKVAEEQLRRKPDDPKANADWGEFLCLYRGDWRRGLPHMARSDGKWATAAKADASKSGTTNPSEVGDLWWQLAEAEDGLPAKQLKHRAAYWYQQALPQLKGFSKATAEKRIEEVKQFDLFVIPPRHDSETQAVAGSATLKTIRVSAGVALIELHKLGLPGNASTGIKVEKGQQVTLKVAGKWKNALNSVRGADLLRIAVGSAGGRAIQYLKGSETVRFTAAGSGFLFMGMDDVITADNSGQLTVEVEIR